MAKLKQIFEYCIQEGIEVDPRGKEKIKKLFEKRKKQLNDLKKEKKQYYDQEKLWNAYDDTRIVFDEKKEIKTVLVGIDMEMPEILLANELNKQGKKIDAIWSHHPEAIALMGLDNVMRLQVDTLHSAGVPINQAEAIMNKRIKEVTEQLSPANPERVSQTCKLLGISFFNTHTPADNHVSHYLEELIKKKKPETLEDLIKILREIPEYKYGIEQKIGPIIFSGEKDSACGKIYIDVTGGTESSPEAYKKLAEKGVGTIIGMHVGKEMKKEAEDNNMNIVIAGHIPSDNIGMNLLIDKVEKKFGKLKVVECSGFRRVKRN